jgi:hypothetical protein
MCNIYFWFAFSYIANYICSASFFIYIVTSESTWNLTIFVKINNSMQDILVSGVGSVRDVT